MKEITIITPPDRPGTVADITECLAKHEVNILEMEVVDDHAHGIVRLQAEPYEVALRVLAEGGFNALSEEVIVIRLKDEPGAIARVSARFREPNINIRALRIMRRDAGWATVILSTDDDETARQLLEDCVV